MNADSSALLWQGPTLVLDAASTRVHAGVLREGAWAAHRAVAGEALETIFAAVDGVLTEAALRLEQLSGIALGIGPGSILGLRLSLMALRAWQQLPCARSWASYEFHGLTVQARILARTAPGDSFHLLTAFRRGAWHHLAVQAGAVGALGILEDGELAGLSGKIHYIPTGRAAANPPCPHEEAPFSLQDLPLLAPGDWARPVTLPALYLPDPPRFARWTAQRHR